ncbi:MAG: nitrate reductase [Kiritimatiellae bacterium]|nr:nitrate reductase [Kiritimatiellia bacterium]
MIGKTTQKIAQKVKSVMVQTDGPLTRDLLLAPGKFGLGKVPVRLQPDATTQTVCGFCSTGCSLNVHMKQGQAINVTPSKDYPVNLGMACPKGWEALAPLRASDRATTPLLRDSHGKLNPVTWETALETFCQRFKQTQEKHGPESVAFLSTGQIVTEEMALLGALTKFGMGMVHGDGNTRQCMATAVAAYKQSFGFDAPPYTYKDFEESDVIVLVGSNLCVAHPIMWERIMMNKNNPEIIVVDPRCTETAMAATRHLALQPKSDLVLLYGIAHILIRQGWVDEGFVARHTSGFYAFKRHVAQFREEDVSQKTGLSVPQLRDFARLIHEGKRVSFWWTMGVNQSFEGTRTAQAIICLALMTGNIGRPGTGANSITGQCNAMGSRMFSNTTCLFGGRDFENPAHRDHVASILDIPADTIPQRNSLPYDKIIEGIGQGKIKGLWVIATNGAHSWINQHHFNDMLEKLDFLVVQDMYHSTETAVCADLVLPAAGWGEKDGTFINSERRIGRVSKVSKAPGEALSDFLICKLIAEYWGCAEMFASWTDPEAVFQKLASLSAGQPCDFSGIDGYDMLEKAGGIQWPFTGSAEEQSSERRLFEDGRFHHPDERARFIFGQPCQILDKINDDYPFCLLTGRGSVSEWHTGTRTSKSAVLQTLSPSDPLVEINPKDARRLELQRGDWVVVSSRRGKMRAKTMVTYTVQPGQVFISMHHPHANRLTDSSFDPHSRQPSYKACAVRVEPAAKTPA